MSYNVRLDSNILATGRAFMHTFVPGGFLDGNRLPQGVGALLDTFVSRAEATWKNYKESFLGDDAVSSDAFRGDFLKAMTFLSLAGETILRHDGMLSIFFHPKFPHAGVQLDDEQQNFCTHFSRTLTVMRAVIEQLVDSAAGLRVKSVHVTVPPCAAAQRLQHAYLNYALHLADLALNICVPPDYLYKHPYTSQWLRLRARVLRQIASVYTDAARADEAAINAEFLTKVEADPDLQPTAGSGAAFRENVMAAVQSGAITDGASK
jgi:hypothetical protein